MSYPRAWGLKLEESDRWVYSATGILWWAAPGPAHAEAVRWNRDGNTKVQVQEFPVPLEARGIEARMDELICVSTVVETRGNHRSVVRGSEPRHMTLSTDGQTVRVRLGNHEWQGSLEAWESAVEFVRTTGGARR